VIKTTQNLSSLLDHIFDLSQKVIQSRVFKNQLIELILKSYSERDAILSRDEASNICYCYLLLNKYTEAAMVLVKLINGSEDDFLMACQISADIQAEENENFTSNLLKEFNKSGAGTDEISLKKEKVVSILSGKFNETSSFKFINQNNRSNKDVIAKLKQFWDNKNSIYHNGIINCYAILHAGTSDDTFLNDQTQKAWITKNSHWAKFQSVACLGTIHRRNPKIEEVISKFYPGPGQTDDYIGGGALYALGLSRLSKNVEQKIEFLKNILLTNQKEPIVHGACLGLGLLGMSSHDKDLVESLKVFIYNESAIMGEAAAYSIGLVMAGNMDQDLIQELIDACRNNTHEKIIRGLAMSMALMAYQSEELADGLIGMLMDSKDHIVRYGGAYAVGMAYVGTGNTKALKKLLSIAASDVSDDVRRAAVLNIGFVMLNQHEKVPKIINLLINSYNSQVRFGAAMAIGISCAGTNFKDAMTALQSLQQDPASFVRQGVTIGMALVMQQATKNHNPIVEDFKEKLMENVKNKTQDNIYKFGAMLSLGLLEAGGKNCIVTLTSQSGTCKKGAILGMVMFTQYWYWFPFLQMINLSLEPTFLMGVNADLKMPKGFSVKCNTKKSTFDYPPIKKLEEINKEKDKVVIELSTTRRAKAKQALKHKGEGKMDEETLPKTISQIDTETDKKDEKEVKQEKMEPEELPTCELPNPCRVLKKQQNFIEFVAGNRYQPIMKVDVANGRAGSGATSSSRTLLPESQKSSWMTNLWKPG
jgi:26S proteasome regulatory subunit N2